MDSGQPSPAAKPRRRNVDAFWVRGFKESISRGSLEPSRMLWSGCVCDQILSVLTFVVILKVGEVSLLGLVLVEAKCCGCSRLDRVLRYISAGFPLSLVDLCVFFVMVVLWISSFGKLAIRGKWMVLHRLISWIFFLLQYIIAEL